MNLKLKNIQIPNNMKAQRTRSSGDFVVKCTRRLTDQSSVFIMNSRSWFGFMSWPAYIQSERERGLWYNQRVTRHNMYDM